MMCLHHLDEAKYESHGDKASNCLFPVFDDSVFFSEMPGIAPASARPTAGKPLAFDFPADYFSRPFALSIEKAACG